MFKWICLITFWVVSICHADNFELWKDDEPCVPKEFISSVNKKQYNSVNEVAPQVWYMPLYSKYELYHTSSLISHIPVEDLTDDDIKRACLTVSEEEPGVFVYKGFGGKKIDVVTEPAADGGLKWKLRGETKFRGELYITLATDDYSVTVTCWGNGRRSFSAASKTTTFDSATRNIIVEHVTILGFNPKHFVDYNYDQCDAKGKNMKQKLSFNNDFIIKKDVTQQSSTFSSTLNTISHEFWRWFGF